MLRPLVDASESDQCDLGIETERGVTYVQCANGKVDDHYILYRQKVTSVTTLYQIPTSSRGTCTCVHARASMHV